MVAPLGSPASDPASSELDLYRLAMEEERRCVDLQRLRLDNIRSRSLQYLGYIGASSAFLVGTSLTASTTKGFAFYGLAIAGTVLWVLTALYAYLVITARPVRFAPAGRRTISIAKLEWEWGLEAREALILADQRVPRTRAQNFASEMADQYAKAALWNKPQLELLERFYSGLILLASTQLGVWLLLAWVKV